MKRFFSGSRGPLDLFQRKGLSETLATPGPHETALTRLFGAEGMRRRSDGLCFQTPLVVIAFTNRSGSNLLADYVRQGKVAGPAGEFLNHDFVTKHAREQGITRLPDYMLYLQTRFAGPAGALAIKASWDQLAMLHRTGLTGMFPEVRVLHMLRQDVLAQAVSYVIALHTKQWTSKHAVEQDEVPFKPDLIEHVAADFHQANLLIRLICDATGMRRWALAYEQMCHDPATHVGNVLVPAGLAPKDWAPDVPRISKQAGPRNAEMQAAVLARLRAVL
ncbi:Stf0 family sulfotransferase [Mesobacterium sp. TK19101]|uniref:Stf0 family sulfotransferase n=1 Tax=Mesobacterium hydrothermale TaxID=3111907 RepID=A0ABU6HK40_9RHOB|nr:Stf0 family sulfotransferase [Mesobacterium sp. TK19101]MEC3862681.1 Stf0 family sulfotransferase [Mesobacterium sp. TK19101]